MVSHQVLRAWHAHALTKRLLESAAVFPRDERDELTMQRRRAALSVPTNLVEGCARFGPREFLRHVRIAIASLAEAGYPVFLARDLGHLTAEVEESLQAEISRVRGLLFLLAKGLQKAVARRAG